MEENEQGEMVPKKKAGPWRVVQNPTPVVEEESAPASVAQPAPPQQQPTTYVAPSLRHAARNSPSASATPFSKYFFYHYQVVREHSDIW